MSEKSTSGKAAWMARAATYDDDLTTRITDNSKARMSAWTARGRIPVRVRIMARLAGHPVRLPAKKQQ